MVLFRFSGHPEFNPSLDMKDRHQNWQVSLSGECWVCDRWNYVIVFFHKRLCWQQMENIERGTKKFTALHDYLFANAPIDTGDELNEQNNASKVGKAPMISGSVTGWKLHEMTELTELLERFALMREVR